MTPGLKELRRCTGRYEVAPCTAPCPCNVVRDWKPLFWVETSLTELKFVRSLVRVLKLELERPLLLLLLLLKLDTSLLLTLLLPGRSFFGSVAGLLAAEQTIPRARLLPRASMAVLACSCSTVTAVCAPALVSVDAFLFKLSEQIVRTGELGLEVES